METLRIGCILDLFGSAVWGEYFVASLRIRVATLIDFRLLSIRVATLIDFNPFFDQGRYPNQCRFACFRDQGPFVGASAIRVATPIDFEDFSEQGRYPDRFGAFSDQGRYPDGSWILEHFGTGSLP